MVDDDGVGVEGGEEGIENEGFDVGGVADHGENDVRSGGKVGRGIDELSAEGEEGGGFGGGAGVDGDGVAGGDEARNHGAAHYADAYPSNAGSGRANRAPELTVHFCSDSVEKSSSTNLCSLHKSKYMVQYTTYKFLNRLIQHVGV